MADLSKVKDDAVVVEMTAVQESAGGAFGLGESGKASRGGAGRNKLLDLDPTDYPDWKTPLFSAFYSSRALQTGGARKGFLIVSWLLFAAQVAVTLMSFGPDEEMKARVEKR